MRIGIREIMPDVASAHGAQQRVADRVAQRICIAMPIEALVMRDIDPSEDQLASFHQAVHIVSITDSE